jgi:predicted phosphodiesterase
VDEAISLAYEGLSNYDIADRLGVSEASIRRGFKSAGFERHMIPTNSEFLIELDKPVTLQGDVMITADWHIPLYDPAYANEMIKVAREQELKTLIIGGDFFNFDALSRYEPKQEDAGLERELDEGVRVMRTLQETFDRIIYIWGNHDARLHKALGMKIAFSSAMKNVFNALGRDEVTKIEFSNLDHCWVETEKGDWYICHPDMYTRVPLSGARVLATKLNANVITAHSHHCAVGYAIDGQKVVAEIGGLFDRTVTSYLQRSTTFPTWAQGFAFLKDGRLNVHSPGWSLV